MTLTSLPILLYLIPLTVLAAALVPQNRRTVPLALGGMVYAFLTGGWESVTVMLLMSFSAWFTVRLQPHADDGRRAALRWIYCGCAVQVVLMSLASSLVPEHARMPLLLCAVQGIFSIRQRGLTKMHLPGLMPYFGYACTLPRLFAGPVLSYEESYQMHNAAEKADLKTLGEGAEICARGLFQLVMLSLPMETLWHRLRTEVTLVSTPDALLTLPVIYFTIYYRLKGAATLGQGIAHMMGLKYADSFDSPVSAFSFKGYFSRVMIPLTNCIRLIFLPEGKKIDTFTYCARVLPLMAGMGLFLRDGASGMVFGILLALMLGGERFLLERWLTGIPKPIRRFGTGLLLMLCMGILYSADQSETLNFFMTLLGRNSIALSSPVLYMLTGSWVSLLFCIIGQLPLRKWGKSWEERHSILAKCKVIAVPLLTFAVTVFCMAELFSRYLR